VIGQSDGAMEWKVRVCESIRRFGPDCSCSAWTQELREEKLKLPGFAEFFVNRARIVDTKNFMT
jgi:hypothetical protein